MFVFVGLVYSRCSMFAITFVLESAIVMCVPWPDGQNGVYSTVQYVRSCVRSPWALSFLSEPLRFVCGVWLATCRDLSIRVFLCTVLYIHTHRFIQHVQHVQCSTVQ